MRVSQLSQPTSSSVHQQHSQPSCLTIIITFQQFELAKKANCSRKWTSAFENVIVTYNLPEAPASWETQAGVQKLCWRRVLCENCKNPMWQKRHVHVQTCLLFATFSFLSISVCSLSVNSTIDTEIHFFSVTLHESRQQIYVNESSF